MKDSKEYWNNFYRNLRWKSPTYDLWLDKYRELLDISNDIIDLGCGSGGDTLYLLEKGYNVVSCDFSDEALKILNEFIPGVKTINVDITQKLPFNDNSISLVIADLSLHYFNDILTKKVIEEIYRILTQDGHLICRVNSVNDIECKLIEGDEIEKNFYYTENGYKRFFDRYDIIRYFEKWKILSCSEDEILKYRVPKIAWEVLLKKNY